MPIIKIEALWDGVSKFVSNASIADNKWHNVVAVYYLGSADLYIDGVLDSSTFNLKNPSPTILGIRLVRFMLIKLILEPRFMERLMKFIFEQSLNFKSNKLFDESRN
jgi:hypothetical protein